MERKFLLIPLLILGPCLGALRGQADDPPGKWGLGANLHTQKLIGDTRTGDFALGFTPAIVRYQWRPALYLQAQIATPQISTRTLNSRMLDVGFFVGHRFRRHSTIRPLLYAGLGAINFKLNDGNRYWDGYLAVGGGGEWFLSRAFGLNLTTDFRYTTGDDLDGGYSGFGRDAFLNVSLGLNYYFGRQKPDETPTEITAEEISGDDGVQPVVAVTEKDAAPSAERSTIPPDSLKLRLANLSQALREKEELVRLYQAKVEWADRQARAMENRALASGAVDLDRTDTPTTPFLRGYRAALQAFAEQDYDAAIEQLRTLLNEDVDPVARSYCWYWLGESFYAKGEYEFALMYFDKIVTSAPDSPKKMVAEVMLALSRMKSGKLSEAGVTFERVLQSYPNSEFAPLVHEYLLQIEGKER